jgi:hypothetical protein
MLLDPPQDLYSRRRLGPSSKLYWLNIDVGIDNIYYRHRPVSRELLAHQKPQFLQYCLLHGIGEVANALTIGEAGADFDHFVVDIASLSYADDHHSDLEPRPSAKMIWSELEPRRPRLEMYIPGGMLRHIIELYVTKRIDRVAMFMQIAVTAESFVEKAGGADILPLLDGSGHLYFRHTQCELLSVYTSLKSGSARVQA